MTPAERQYDLDLVVSLRRRAFQVEPRSASIAVSLRQAADRIETLTALVPVEQPASPPPVPPEPMHG